MTGRKQIKDFWLIHMSPYHQLILYKPVPEHNCGLYINWTGVLFIYKFMWHVTPCHQLGQNTKALCEKLWIAHDSVTNQLFYQSALKPCIPSYMPLAFWRTVSKCIDVQICSLCVDWIYTFYVSFSLFCVSRNVHSGSLVSICVTINLETIATVCIRGFS